MASFARYYGWFLVVATGLPGLVRLVKPRAVAEITSERIASERKRSRHRKWGWISLLASLGLIPVYLWWTRAAWVIFAFIIGVLTGLEMIGNANSPSPDSLTRQNIIYGAVYAVAAVAAYIFLIRP